MHDLPISALVGLEHEPRPGELTRGTLHASWNHAGIRIDDTDLRFHLGAGERPVVQLSRSRRMVEAGWLARTLGDDDREEHLAHLELRTAAGLRARLSAVMHPDRLEGLPEMALDGSELDADGQPVTSVTTGAQDALLRFVPALCPSCGRDGRKFLQP